MPGSTSTRTKRSGILRAAIAGLMVVVVAGLIVWLRPARVTPEPGRPVAELPQSAQASRDVNVGYIGSRSCRECHREIWDEYQRTPMGRSLSRVESAERIEDYAKSTTFDRGGRTYRVESRGDQILHHESAIDGGETLYDQAVEVQYALGSGQRGRSYVIDRGGRLFLSPIAWYSQGRRWDLSPGFAAKQHPRFERPVTGRCLGCHVGRASPQPGSADRFLSPPVREEAIGCESCHGPGEKHVRFHQDVPDASRQNPVDPIVNPSKLDPPRRDSVCLQCHLQGIEEVLRPGRGDYDFRPGMHVGEVWTIFVAGTGVGSDEQTVAVSQVQQMHASACFRGSGGTLGCTSCHDPHSTPDAADRADFYRRKCLECHANAGCTLPLDERQRPPASDSCTHCHMPRLGASDVPHTTQTDHRVPRRPAKSSRKAFRDSQDVEPEVFEAHVATLTAQELNRARGLLLARQAEVTRDAEAARRAEELLHPSSGELNDPRVADALGVCCLLQGRPADAEWFWRRSLALDPDRETALLSLGMLASDRQPAESLGYFDRLVATNPWIAAHHGRRAIVLERTGDPAAALAAARRALELDPSKPAAYEWLADACQRAGDEIEARRLRGLRRRLTEAP